MPLINQSFKEDVKRYIYTSQIMIASRFLSLYLLGKYKSILSKYLRFVVAVWFFYRYCKTYILKFFLNCSKKKVIFINFRIILFNLRFSTILFKASIKGCHKSWNSIVVFLRTNYIDSFSRRKKIILMFPCNSIVLNFLYKLYLVSHRNIIALVSCTNNIDISFN